MKRICNKCNGEVVNIKVEYVEIHTKEDNAVVLKATLGGYCMKCDKYNVWEEFKGMDWFEK